MNQGIFVDLIGKSLLLSLELGGPALLASLIVGLLVSIFQTVTSINEMTLTFIPKIAAVVLITALLGPWMLNTFLDFTANLFINLAQYAH